MTTYRLDTQNWLRVLLDAWRMPVGYFGGIFVVAIAYEKVVGPLGMNVPLAELWPYFLGAIVAVGLLRWENLHRWTQDYELEVDEAARVLADGEQSYSSDELQAVVALPGGGLRLERSGDAADLLIPGHLEKIERLRETLASWHSIDDHTTGLAAVGELGRRYGAWIGAVLLPFVLAHILQTT